MRCAVCSSALAAQVRENDVDVVIVAGDVFDSAAPAAACYTLLTDTLARPVRRRRADHRDERKPRLRGAARLPVRAAARRHPRRHRSAVGRHADHDRRRARSRALLRHPVPRARARAAPVARAPSCARSTRRSSTSWGSSAPTSPSAAAGRSRSRTASPRASRRRPGVEREIRQGSLDVVPLSAFEGPDYVALGHIHGRQQLSERVRYAGAPLHYSFGEADKPRGSWLVDLDAVGLASVAWLDLPVPRRLKTLRGSLDELLDRRALRRARRRLGLRAVHRRDAPARPDAPTAGPVRVLRDRDAHARGRCAVRTA